MPRYYKGDKVTVEVAITEDGVLTDPAEVNAQYRIGRRGAIETLVVNRDGLGMYSVEVPITQGGVAYHVKIITSDPYRAIRRHINVERDVFDTTDTLDYPVAGSI